MGIPDDEIDHDLLDFMRAALQGNTEAPPVAKPKTYVLESAQYIFDNAIDVALSREHVVKAAENIYTAMTKKAYSTETWSSHELHPKEKNEATVDFIFTMDLLNFSFWSELPPDKRFAVEYKGKTWSGYWSLVALLQRALDEGIPITTPSYWIDTELCTDEQLRHVFRSNTDEPFALLEERFECLREAGRVLCDRYDGSFANMIDEADGSAVALVVRLADEMECFRDEHMFEKRPVNFYKRAQILVADIWACFNGTSFGYFEDIDDLTMFADYRVPVTLTTLNCLLYGPTLEAHIKEKKIIPSGSSWEVQLRGASVWCVEQIRREILRNHPEAKVNAVLIDFYLYDTAKEMEEKGTEMIPHHRTRSIWY
ncbi:hypothetical protein FPQ18DRAFT_319353 [Pyronema domesticum]|uniref:Queuosine 5'-phosphate N-glycosylase/hydrolase n=1 Tax=Pyronema omphalodes (strain CBS 100304) TaxID=1076935 RepID=U4L043_PYROM|nr:hypothetical protein FPQ18DRAFT_319353 [Pyronema domesticum]CCX07405.1 Similar to UPF0553 protein v1g230591; acc. no. A7SNN9 [Pyronema omphalodes CBS 100304]